MVKLEEEGFVVGNLPSDPHPPPLISLPQELVKGNFNNE